MFSRPIPPPRPAAVRRFLWGAAGLLAPVAAVAADLGCAPPPIARAVACDGGGCDGGGCDGSAPSGLGPGCFGGSEFGPGRAAGNGESEAGTSPTVGGWSNFGYHSDSDGLFNDRPGKFATHQAWLYAERLADGTDGPGFGFRADAVYGLDAPDTQAFGNEPGTFDYHPESPDNFFNRGTFGWAIPQLYGQAAAGPWDVKLGHFLSPLGYEAVPAPQNFFYSRAFTTYNLAFTHTGLLTTYDGGEGVTLYNGYTFGWNTGFDAFDDGDGSGGANYLGGAAIELTDALSLTYLTTVGDLGHVGEGYVHSVVADWAAGDRLNYVFQTDYYDAETNSPPVALRPTGPPPGPGRPDEAGVQFYGVVNHLFYDLTDRVRLGGRAEWFKADGSSIYETTAGVNFLLRENLRVRPEYRYQWGADRGFDLVGFDRGETDGGIFGVDAVLTF